MIAIDSARCTGCGACVEVCPTGALYLVDGKAAVDEGLCRECAACLSACPVDAISLGSPPATALLPVGVAAPHQEAAMARAVAAPLRSPVAYAPLTRRARMLPALAAALAWTAREIVPRLADCLLDRLDRVPLPASRPSTRMAGRSGSGRRQGARRSRRRQQCRRRGRQG